MHVIAAKAVCFGEALKDSFKDYQRQIVKNSAALAKSLIDNGFGLVSGGTDNHLILIDLRKSHPELTGKALTEHANRLFQMYAGEQTAVKLRFHRSLINAVIDRFGREVMLIPDGEEHFVFTAEVAVSPMFLSWVIGFGQKAKILYPESVVQACQDLCREALAQYDL